MKPLLALSLALISTWSLASTPAWSAPEFFEKTGTCSNLDCCSFNTDWEVRKKAQVLDLSNFKKVVAHIYPAEKVRALDGLTRSERGWGEFRSTASGFKKGQRVPIYLMASDDTLYLWQDGELEDIEPGQVKVIRPSKYKNYIKLKTSSGAEGWVELESLNPSC